MDFCDSENRNHLVETEKQMLESGMSTEFQEDLNMAIGGDGTDGECEKHDNENNMDDNEESEEDMEDENSLPDENSLSDENLDQDDNEDTSLEESNKINIKSKNDSTDDEDEIENKDSEHGDASEQADDGEDLWEDIYGRQRDKKGNVVSKKYVPPAVRSADTSDNEKTRRLERQLKGILNRLAEQNMHTIANQVII